MPSGRPLTPEQKSYILQNKENFVGEISKKLGLNHKTITNFLNKKQPKF